MQVFLAFRPLIAMALASAAGASLAATPVFFGPSAYRSASDIPVGFYAGGTPTLLETLEDGSLDASLAGTGGVLLPSHSLRDSVDADDGSIDGTCSLQTSGRCVSWFNGNGAAGVGFSFTGSGPLPTAFGLVWTDGGGTITFSAMGAGGVSLGSISASGFADQSFNGTTGEDRFFGLQFAGGIQSISISNSSGGIEVDHIQYGSMVSAVPEPSSWALALCGALVIGAKLRRQTPRRAM